MIGNRTKLAFAILTSLTILASVFIVVATGNNGSVPPIQVSQMSQMSQVITEPVPSEPMPAEPPVSGEPNTETPVPEGAYQPDAFGNYPFNPWRFSRGNICWRHNLYNIWPNSEAVLNNAIEHIDTYMPELSLVQGITCENFPQSQQIRFEAWLPSVNHPHRDACAFAATWVENARVIMSRIYVNARVDLFDSCFGNDYLRVHVVSHEIGHPLTLRHVDYCGSVMDYCDFTPAFMPWWDINHLRAMYPRRKRPIRTDKKGCSRQ